MSAGYAGNDRAVARTHSELLTYSFWSSNTRKLLFETGNIQLCLEKAYKEWVTPYETKGVD